MADDIDLKVGVGADVNGNADLKAFANTIATVSDAVRNLVTDAKSVASALDKVEKNVAGVSTGNKNAVKQIKDTTAALREQASAAKSIGVVTFAQRTSVNATGAARDVSGTAATGGAPSNIGVVTKAQREALEATNAARQVAIRLEEKATAELREQLTLRRQALEAARQSRIGTTPQTGTGAGSAAAVAGRMAAAGTFTAMDEQALKNARASYDEAKNALGSYNDGLANTRYAMYAFSNAVGIGGAALTAMSVGVVKVAADFETMYANIERTSGLTGTALQNLESEFLSLGQEIPASFADLGNIATLAGQLNIPAGRIAAFTETVAKFTATTGVTVDSATTAFGRLDALLPDVQGNYEALGSSILNVGVNSVATEQDIISTTTQIAAAGAQAGFAADEVIGLAASYASLGIAPEAARGTTIRVFSEIRGAVQAGGDELETFSKLAGMSGEEFQKAWSNSATTGETFIKVLGGLQTEGANAEDTLRGLGITAVRDINALLRLSQNTELVAENFGYAADGFAQGTQLGSSFQKIAETLAAKVQVLANNFQAFLATIGGTGLGVIGGVVDGLSEMLKFLTELAQNPFFQSVTTVIGSLVALSGIVMLASSGFGHIVASLLAGRPVMAFFNQSLDVMRGKLNVVKAEAALTGTSLSTMGASAKIAGTAVKGALISTGIGAGVVVALSAITYAWQEIASATQSAGDYAKETVGDFGALTQALKDDTAAADGHFKGMQTIEGSLSTTKETTAEWVGTLEQATGAQLDLSTGVTGATESIKPQTLAIGENTQAWLANMLVSSKAAQELVKALSATNGSGFDTNGFFGALVEGDIAKAEQIRDAFYEIALARATLTDSGPIIQSADQAILDGLNSTIKVTSGSLDEAKVQAVVTQAVMGDLGNQAAVTGEGLDVLGEGASSAADNMSVLEDAIAGAFSQQNVMSAFASDFYTLISAIYEGGASFSVFDQAGQVNLANLQSSIATTITAAQTMGVGATEAVGILFQRLQQSGVDTAQLLASLAGMQIPGVSLGGVSNYVNGSAQMTQSGQQMANVMNQMAANAKRAAAAVGGGGGGGGGLGGAAKKAGTAAKKAAAEVRTLADYASDLGKVFSRSFELRFSTSNGLDDITTGWREIAKATAEANKKIEEARVSMMKLTSDRSIQEYFLTIANQYGDGLRADAITADIADINSKIAEETNKVAEANVDASKELTGNSDAAIKNRQTIQGLVQNYQSLLESYASSGMSQADLAVKSQELKAQFEAQAVALGFSREQVNAYSASFVDMTTVINKIPRNVTVATNINNGPAFLALAEFEAQAKKSGDAAGAKAGAGAVGGIKSALAGMSIPPLNLPPVIVPVKYKTPSYDQLMAMQATIRAQTGDPNFRIALGPGGQGGQTFATGGYTGGSSASDLVGAVHGKEYVINADNTARLGLPFLDALNNGKMPTGSQVQARSSNSHGPQVVDFSAQAAQILADALNLEVIIPGAAISKATSRSNVNSSTRRAS